MCSVHSCIICHGFVNKGNRKKKANLSESRETNVSSEAWLRAAYPLLNFTDLLRREIKYVILDKWCILFMPCRSPSPYLLDVALTFPAPPSMPFFLSAARARSRCLSTELKREFLYFLPAGTCNRLQYLFYCKDWPLKHPSPFIYKQAALSKVEECSARKSSSVTSLSGRAGPINGSSSI